MRPHVAIWQLPGHVAFTLWPLLSIEILKLKCSLSLLPTTRLQIVCCGLWADGKLRLSFHFGFAFVAALRARFYVRQAGHGGAGNGFFTPVGLGATTVKCSV